VGEHSKSAPDGGRKGGQNEPGRRLSPPNSIFLFLRKGYRQRGWVFWEGRGGVREVTGGLALSGPPKRPPKDRKERKKKWWRPERGLGEYRTLPPSTSGKNTIHKGIEGLRKGNASLKGGGALGREENNEKKAMVSGGRKRPWAVNLGGTPPTKKFCGGGKIT